MQNAQIYAYPTFLSALLILFTKYGHKLIIGLLQNHFGYATFSECTAADQWQCIERVQIFD